MPERPRPHIYEHHDRSLRSLPPLHGFTPLEVFDLHCAMGIARRAAPQLGGDATAHVDSARSALWRVGVWYDSPEIPWLNTSDVIQLRMWTDHFRILEEAHRASPEAALALADDRAAQTFFGELSTRIERIIRGNIP